MRVNMCNLRKSLTNFLLKHQWSKISLMCDDTPLNITLISSILQQEPPSLSKVKKKLGSEKDTAESMFTQTYQI